MNHNREPLTQTTQTLKRKKEPKTKSTKHGFRIKQHYFYFNCKLATSAQYKQRENESNPTQFWKIQFLAEDLDILSL